MPSHRLSRASIGLVPRSLDALIERHASPSTPETPEVDQVLLATTASAVREMQKEMETMKGQLLALRQQVKELTYMVT